MGRENGSHLIGNNLSSDFIDAVVEGNKSKIIETFRAVRLRYERNESGVEGLTHAPRGMTFLNDAK